MSTLDLGDLEAHITVNDSGMEEGLDQGESRFRRWGDKLKVAAAAAGVIIAGALSMALAEAMELDAAQAELTAQLGDEKFAKDMGRIAGHMYTEGWGESVRDNMASVRAILSSGLLAEDATDDAIERATTAAQALADAFEQEVKPLARSAGQMVRTGLAANAEEAFDILTRGFQQIGDLSEDTLDTIDEYGTQFRKLGLTGVQVFGLLSQGVRAGARDIDTVADGLKEFAIRAADGSTTSAAGFQAIGLNAAQMTKIFAKGGPEAAAAMDMVLDRLRALKDPVAREAAAVALFGTKAEDMQAALMGLDLSTAAGELGDVAGASQKVADALGNSASAQLDSFKRKAQMALVEQLAKAVPYLTDLAKWGNANKDWLIPAVGVLGALAGVLAVVVAITKVYTIVQGALNIVMMMSPLGLLVLAIIALVAGFVILYAKVSWFREGIQAVFGWLIGAAQLWWSIFSGIWSMVGRWFVTLFTTWWSIFSGFWTMVFDGATAGVKWVYAKVDALVGFVTGLPGRLAAAGRNMWDFVWTSFRSAINAVISRWNRLSFHIPGISIPGLGQVWGGMTLNLPDIPMLAVGGDITRTGLAVVHTGERVVPAARAERMRDGDSGPGVVKKILLIGTGLLAGLREEISLQGGDVQTVLGGAP